MPNGHDYSKEYGNHDYGNQVGTCDCKHGCGCWMGPARSGGPLGVDPFGECPGNPKDGKRLGGQADQEIVVTRRIRGLEQKLNEAEQELQKLLKIKGTPEVKMAEELATVTKERDALKQTLLELGETAKKVIREYTTP